VLVEKHISEKCVKSKEAGSSAPLPTPMGIGFKNPKIKKETAIMFNLLKQYMCIYFFL